ncbi:MAG: hypothetical protein ACK55Z_07585, partial [bacterium]
VKIKREVCARREAGERCKAFLQLAKTAFQLQPPCLDSRDWLGGDRDWLGGDRRYLRAQAKTVHHMDGVSTTCCDALCSAELYRGTPESSSRRACWGSRSRGFAPRSTVRETWAHPPHSLPQVWGRVLGGDGRLEGSFWV